SARVVPCRARCVDESPSRVTRMEFAFASCATFTPAACLNDRLPLGPPMLTTLPLILGFTPEGTVIGFFPIRDIFLNPQHRRLVPAVLINARCRAALRRPSSPGIADRSARPNLWTTPRCPGH